MNKNINVLFLYPWDADNMGEIVLAGQLVFLHYLNRNFRENDSNGISIPPSYYSDVLGDGSNITPSFCDST